jgi:VanZ family protein
MYAGFCSVIWLEYFRSHKSVNRIKVFLLAVVAPIIFGGVIEVAQGTMTVYRGMDWYDFIFNSIGVIFALFFAKFILHPWMIKFKENSNSGK